MNSGGLSSQDRIVLIALFCRCSVPEPLSRVLEPVSVTHLDHSDADYDTLTKHYRNMDSQKSLYLDEEDENFNDKEMSRTQSDGADPGEFLSNFPIQVIKPFLFLSRSDWASRLGNAQKGN